MDLASHGLPEAQLFMADFVVPPNPKPAVPKGEVQHYVFDHSKSFPGAVCDDCVYVPRPVRPSPSLNLYRPPLSDERLSASADSLCPFGKPANL